MSGKSVFRNIMSILLPGVNTIITERTNQVYGKLLEKAVQLSLEIIILVLEKDLLLSDFWRPLYQVSFYLTDSLAILVSNVPYKLCKMDLGRLSCRWIYIFN